MATIPPQTILPLGPTGSPCDATPEVLAEVLAEVQPEVLAEALVALHGKASAIALLARLALEPVEIGGELGAVIARAQPWQRALVAQTIGDCGAMLESGLVALGTLSRRGQDTAVPALVLWREFHAARASMVSVLTSEPA